MFRTYLLMGTWVLSECVLLVSVVVRVFQWMKRDVSNSGPVMWIMMLWGYTLFCANGHVSSCLGGVSENSKNIL
jgi:hypothetical protein